MNDLHGQIMNIQTTSAGIGKAVEAGMAYDNDWESRMALAYKIGHRDARHAAAEMSISVQAQRDELLAEVEEWRAIKAAYLIEYAARPNKLHPRQYHGHAHDLDGIWDRDNGALAGCQCVACMMHRAAIAHTEKRPCD